MNDNRDSNDGLDNASRRRFRGDDRSSYRPPPASGTIWEGNIHRIQPYGAFCSFGPLPSSVRYGQQERRTWQGLIHISQLFETRVEKVEDVVDIDDNVWVKVIEVERQYPPNFNRDQSINDDKAHHAQSRYRIKLSMKDVSQDGTGQDLGREREAKEQVTTQLQTNLNSMIGMGVALDPMERLVLKNNHGNCTGNNNSNIASTKTTFRGGYTLVDDNEGEPEPDSSTDVNDSTNSAYRTAPMGRGRGATLPAWMTSTEGPVGISDDPKQSQASRKGLSGNDEIVRDKYRDHSDNDDGSRQRPSSKNENKQDSKRRKKKRRHRHRRRHLGDDYRDVISTDASDSENSRYYDSERRHRKRHKSGSRHHRQKGHRKPSSGKKDKKRRKASHHRDNYKKADDKGNRRSKSLRYRSDESTLGNDTRESSSSSSLCSPNTS